jgi:hypothetical protein
MKTASLLSGSPRSGAANQLAHVTKKVRAKNFIGLYWLILSIEKNSRVKVRLISVHGQQQTLCHTQAKYGEEVLH